MYNEYNNPKANKNTKLNIKSIRLGDRIGYNNAPLFKKLIIDAKKTPMFGEE